VREFLRNKILVVSGLALSLVLGMSAPLTAQWSVRVSSLTSYDQNAFRNYLGLEDWVEQVLLNVGRQFTSEHADVALSYNGGFVFFREYSDRRFMVHGAALDATLYLAGGNFPLDVGVSFSQRFDKEAYQIFDNHQFSVYVSKRFPGVTGLPEIGVSYTNRIYPNLSDYSHSEWSVYAVARKFFPTKTTLIVRSNLGYRAFAKRVFAVTEPVDDWTEGTGWGWMRGGHGRDHWNNFPWWPGPGSTVRFLVDAPRILLLNGGVRLAQSLGETAGLSLDARGWYSPSGGGRALDRSIYGYDPSDLIFDDPFNYDGSRFTLQLTKVLWPGSQLAVGATAEKRWYRDRPALALDGQTTLDPERRDERGEFWATFQSPLRVFKLNLGTMVDVRWIDNRSNDPYYQWSGLSATVGLRMAF